MNEEKLDPSEVMEMLNLMRGLLRRVDAIEVKLGMKEAKAPPCPYCNGDGGHRDFCHLKGRR